MSRFGLRSRLKSALGMGRKDEPRFDVTFVLPDGKEGVCEAEPRYTLVMASQQLDTPIATGCPDGHCGECVVEIAAGAEGISPPSAAEQAAYTHGQGKKTMGAERLACHARVVGGGARVKIRRVWTMDTQRGV
jgi:ferredoxin